MTTDGAVPPLGGDHDALLYDSIDDYLMNIAAFVHDGVAKDEPILVAVPNPKVELLRQALPPSDEITFIDMMDLGRNPARIIPAVRRFVYGHGGRRTRFVGEPAWPGRTPAEVREVMLHESLLDSALTGSPISVLCPYDSGALGSEIIEAAWRLHSHLIDPSGRHASETYQPDISSALFASPLPAPPPSAERLVFDDDLARLRHFVENGAVRTGLDPVRLQDLLLAVNEVATNTAVHVGTPGLIQSWHDRAAGELLWDLRDDGHITEPLVGRFGPYPVALNGWGLWMVNQVCDLVELRSGQWGTNVRLHISLT